MDLGLIIYVARLGQDYVDVAYVARAGLFGMGSHRVHKIARFKKFSNC